jgi:AcrR family transcriptional regulator
MHSAEQLFDAICRLMDTKKFDDIGIKEVSEVAGIGRATFYRNFDYVEDVLKLKLDQTFAELKQTFEPSIDNEPVDLVPFFQFWAENKTILNALEQAGKWEIFTTRFGQATLINLAQFSDQMGFSEVQFEYLQRNMRGMFSTILHTWVERGTVENASELNKMFELPFILYMHRNQNR